MPDHATLVEKNNASYLYGTTLPTPTNKQNARLLRRLCNSLGLLKTTTCRLAIFSCVLCGKDITNGDEYKNGGYARRAHVYCLTETAKRLAERGL